MDIFAQHGYGVADKIADGLSDEVIQGVILSPRDIDSDQLPKRLEQWHQKFPNKEILLDPQLYAAYLRSMNNSRLSYLPTYPYFPTLRNRSDYEKVSVIAEDIRKTLKYQSELGLNKWIAPNVYVPGSLDSIWGSISKNFLRHSNEIIHTDYKDQRWTYLTWAFSSKGLNEKDEVDDILQEISLWKDRPTGFYLLISPENLETGLFNDGTISLLLYLVYSLSFNNYEVIIGYADYLSPFLCMVGGKIGATGWSSNLRNFTMNQFLPLEGTARQPRPRYSSAPLIRRILVDELRAANDVGVAEVLSRTIHDDAFLKNDVDKNIEALEHWDSIGKLKEICDGNDVQNNCKRAIEYVQKAESIYEHLSKKLKISLDKGSDNSHLEPLREGIKKFLTLI